MTKIYFICLFTFFVTLLNSQIDVSRIDSLENRLETELNDSIRVDVLNELSLLYYRVSLEKEEKYAYEAYELAVSIDYLKGEITALKNIGVAKRKLGEPLDTILYYYNTSLKIAEQENYIDVKIALLNNIAIALDEHEQYHRSLNYLLRALDLDEAHMPLTWKRPTILANIGSLYYKLEDYQKALNYYTLSYDMAAKHGYDNINLMHVHDIAAIKYKLGDTQNAEQIVLGSLDQMREQGDFESYYQAMIVLIDIKIDENQLTEAKALAASTLEQLDKNDFPLYRCQVYHRLADIEIQLENPKTALDYSLKSSTCADGNSSPAVRIEALRRLYEAFNILGDNDKKDSIHYQYASLAQAEIDRKLSLAIEEEEAKYENLLKQREIELLIEEQNISNKQMKVLIGGIVSFLLLSLITGYLYIRRNRIANKLSAKNKELKKVEQNLEEKNDILEKYIESNIQLTQFAHIASHDLKSPLRTVSSFIGLAMNSAKDRLQQNELEYMKLSLNATKDMYQLVEDLLSYSKVNALDLEIEEVHMPTLMTEVLNHLTYAINEKNASVNVECGISTLYGDRIKLRQVLENLLSNAIKFVKSDQQPTINISCNERENDWLLQVEDNGIGIDKDYVDQVFEPFKQLNTKDEYSGTGLGLSLCKEIIEKHNGQMWVESVLGKGTKVLFTIDKGIVPSI